jgi:hypothetical protein
VPGGSLAVTLSADAAPKLHSRYDHEESPSDLWARARGRSRLLSASTPLLIGSGASFSARFASGVPRLALETCNHASAM